ncbi:unnamed protein product [Symbiodinium sp. CCMP2592]|nr:unnamed protein product [Symbiodinium sp. CCMP2592]
MVRALNQDNVNQTGCDLGMFLPKKKCSLNDGALALEPASTKERPVLKGIGDREQAGQKAWLLLSLKFQGGSNLFDKQVVAEKLAARYAHDPDWMSELAEQISFDRQTDISSDAESCLRWNAELAAGDAYYPTVLKLLRLHQTYQFAVDLRVSAWQSRELQLDGADSWARREQDVWVQAWNVCLELASARHTRCWSQLVHLAAMPNSMAGVFHPRKEVRDTMMGGMKVFFQRIKQAVSRAARNDDATAAALKDLLQDIGYHQSQLVLECWKVMDDAKWDWKDQNVREQAFGLHAGQSTTKMACEDSFAWSGLACSSVVVGLLGSFHLIARWTKWFYASANPTLSKTFNMVSTDLEDIRAVQLVAKSDLHGSSFRSTSSYVPPELELRSLLQGKQQWTRAGTAAEMRQIAAYHVLMMHPQDKFDDIPQLWAGCLFQKGAVAVRGSNAYIILGFRKWATLGVRLNEHQVAGKVYWEVPALDESAKLKVPSVLVNKDASVATCQWKMCAITPVIPALMPAELKHKTSLLTATGELESLPKASVRIGNWLSLENIKRLCKANGIAQPARGTGKPNAKGVRSVLKRDWARVLVSGFFPDLDEESVNEILRKFMGTWDPTKLACPSEVVECVEGLDAEERDQSYIKRVKELAQKAKEAAAEVQGRGFMACMYVVVLACFQI